MSEEDDQGITQTDADQSTDEVVASELGSQLQFESEENGEQPENPVDGEVTKDETSEEVESVPTEQSEEPQKDSNKDQPQETEAERNQRFYELRQEQKRQRQMVERAVDQNYTPQSADALTQHYMDQGYDEFQATVLARDEVRSQKEQIAEARADIAELNMQINTEAMQVLHDFPEFDKSSPQYDAAFASQAAQLYKRSAGAVTDPRTGLVVQTSQTPYEFYKDLHDIWSAGRSNAQVVAQRNVEQQLASTAAPSSTAPIKTLSKEDKEAQDFADALKNA